MKHTFFYTFLLATSMTIALAQGGDPVLMKVGNTDVRVSEFKYIYEKNNGSNADYSTKSINEYLDLYGKFKLKVEKAKQIKMDTIPDLITELAGYRKQLASSYLIDKEVSEFLLKELYERMKYDISFSHIFLPITDGASVAEKETVKNSIRDIKSKIVGGLSFDQAAREYSLDPSTAGKGGAMGFYTAKLPSGFYELESALYNTQVGEVSDIVESSIGFHLVKITAKRPARGTIEVAHIMFDKERKDIADTVYQMLQDGANFESAAMTYSVDKTSGKNGGKLPVFGINTYDGIFEDTAFNIYKDGAYTEPVLTHGGWHIIKRIAKPNMDSYDIFVRKMKSQITKDQRFEAAKIKLISDIKKAGGFKEDKNELNRFTSSLTNDFFSYRWTPSENTSGTTLFSIGGSEVYSVKDFAEYCKKNTKIRLKYDQGKPLNEVIDELYLDYVNESALDFEEKNLEIKHPDFKSLMREYAEGILLFEATKINVWDKANQDSTGLQKYFINNMNQYMWPEKAEITTFTMSDVDKKLALKIYEYSKKNSNENIEKKFNNSKTKNIIITTSEVDKDAPEMSKIAWKVGAISELQLQADSKLSSFIRINKIIPAKQKELSEARGYVVADYQDFLEHEWVKQLSKEFKISIDQSILSQLKR
ncbi:MAG: peptidylprolyl isomerase [Saprospiraceae bacterium]